MNSDNGEYMAGNKIIVVTGASDGIGKAIARKLARGDCTLILVSKNEEKLNDVSSEIKNSRYFICDITDNERVKDIIAKVEKVYGRIDVLVNNAGMWIEGELDANNPEQIRKTLETNLLGQIYVTKAIVPLMKKQKYGIIVNIISHSAKHAKAERSVYDATKFGFDGFTKSLQEELHRYNIRVSGIYPAKVKTNLFSKAGVDKSMDGAIEADDVANVVEFILSQPDSIEIPEIGIRSILYR